MVSRVGRRVDRNRRIDKQSEQNVINSGKATGKVRYYSKVNANQPILLRVALRRAARTLRSQPRLTRRGLATLARLRTEATKVFSRVKSHGTTQHGGFILLPRAFYAESLLKRYWRIVRALTCTQSTSYL